MLMVKRIVYKLVRVFGYFEKWFKLLFWWGLCLIFRLKNVIDKIINNFGENSRKYEGMVVYYDDVF